MGISSIHSTNQTQNTDQLLLKADRVLARRAAAGDREAFRSIVDSHKQRMFTVARSVIKDLTLAEDVVQEAFIKAYRALPEFRGDSLLSTWLYRITYLTAIDMRRQQVRHLRLADELQQESAVAALGIPESGEENLRSKRLKREIDQAITCLSPFEQTVFTLRHMQNFKLREIALVVDRSEGTVKNILFRAIHKVRDQLSEAVPDLLEIKIC